MFRPHILLARRLDHDPSPGYFRALLAALERVCWKRGWQPQLVIDERPTSQRRGLPDELRQALGKGDVAAIMSPVTDARHLRDLAQLNIPVSWHSSSALPGAVGFDFYQLGFEGVRVLSHCGATVIGLVSPLPSPGAIVIQGNEGSELLAGMLFLGRMHVVSKSKIRPSICRILEVFLPTCTRAHLDRGD